MTCPMCTVSAGSGAAGGGLHSGLGGLQTVGPVAVQVEVAGSAGLGQLSLVWLTIRGEDLSNQTLRTISAVCRRGSVLW